MAITPIFETNWAHATLDELDKYVGAELTGSGNISFSSSPTFANSPRSASCFATSAPVGRVFSTTQIISGFDVYASVVNGVLQSYASIIYHILLSTGYVSVRFRGATTFDIRLNGTVVATGTHPGFAQGNYYHFGVSVKADPTNGFVSFYIDGLPVVSYVGNTGTSIGGLFAAGGYNTNATVSSGYIGNYYCHDATGEADSPPPAHQYFIVRPATAGFYSGNWTPNGAATNVQCVDDSPTGDGDTTYTKSTVLNQKESFILAAVGAGFVPPDYTMTGLAVTAMARREDTTLSTLTIGVRESGGSEQYSGEKDLAINYDALYHFFPTNAAAGAWTEGQLAGLEIIVQATGAL